MKKFSLQYAVGEVFFIFLGITLAIAFQNWNEARKEVKLERVVLQQLKVALQNDLNDVNANINTHNRAKKSIQGIFKTLSSPDPIDESGMLRNLMQAVDYTFLVSDISTYEYLKSVGLHIIREDTLRSQITKLYDVVYEGIYGVEKNARPIQFEVLNAIKKYYTGDANLFVPLGNTDEAKRDNEFKFYLKNLEFSHQVMVNKYQKKVKPELEKLIHLVNDAL